MVVYLYDILIFSDNLDQHSTQVCIVWRDYDNMVSTLEMCAFDQTSADFLGFILCPEGIKMDLRKVQAVCH